jgi:NitT/TauT family transport system substrate-binding protein
MKRVLSAFIVFLALVSAWAAPTAAQEITNLRVSKQYGLALLQLMIMEDQKLIEKHAKALGHPGLTTEWMFLRASDVITDGLLSGSIEVATFGLPSLILLNEKTRGRLNVRGLVGFNTVRGALVTRNPEVKRLEDFTEKDRIAVPAVKVSNQAILLQMAAAKVWGDANWQKLDQLTVSMSQPDSTGVMIGGRTEITANFPSQPFLNRQLREPGIHVVIDQEQILGTKTSAAALAVTTPFYEKNPITAKAIVAAFEEATQMINQDKRWAVEQYGRLANDKTPIDELLAMIDDAPDRYTTKIMGIEPWVGFMTRIGMVKQGPARWQDLFFAVAFSSAN